MVRKRLGGASRRHTKRNEENQRKNMLFRHNATVDALGVDRCFASLQREMCYDYTCFVILSVAKDLMFASVGAGLVPALCSRLLFGAPQGMPLRCLFSVLCTLLSFGHPQGMPLRRCSLLSVLCYPLGGHAGIAPTVSVLCSLYSVIFRADTPVPPLLRCSLYSIKIVSYKNTP